MSIDTTEQKTADDGREPSGSSPLKVVPYRRVGTLSSTKRDPATSASTYFITASGSEVLEFGEREYFLWRLLDGRNALTDIQEKFKERFNVALTPQQFGRFVDQLIECGAVEALEPTEAAPPPTSGAPVIAPPLEPAEAALPLPIERRREGFSLFDPTIALRALDTLCGPFRFFRWLLLPALIGLLAWVGLDPSVMPADIPVLTWTHALGVVVLAVLIVGIVPPLSQAVTVSFLGYETPGCRVSRGWLLPRLVFDDADWHRMQSRHVLTVLAVPFLARLALFTAAAGAWLTVGASADLLSALCLAIAVIGLASFLASITPFLPTQGRRWLTAAFSYDDLRTAGGAYWLLVGVLAILWLTVVIACLAVVGAAVLPLHHPAWYDSGLTPTIRSVALAWLATVAVLAPMWLRGMLSNHGALQPSYGYAEGGPQALYTGLPLDGDLRQSRMLVDDGAIRPARRRVAERWPSSKGIIIWATILGCAVAIAFVAYPYEAGGYFTILPHASTQLNARVQGELTEVLVNENDEVAPGQILGVLSDWQQKYNLATAKAQLQNAEANLQHLLETPRPEDVELARKQYEAAAARLPYDKAQFERYAALVTNDNVSRANYDQVLSQYQQDQAAADVARANYDQVRAPPTQAQIDAARAQVRQYTATVAYSEDELERTRIRATSHGTVVTQNPLLLRGKSFALGALVFTVEDHKLLQADVQVPETDIANVRLGGVVRLRFWGIPQTTFPGKVVAIAPSGQTPTSAAPQTPQSGTSNVIRVQALVPNSDGVLRPNTDGYAKMVGVYMPTWQAFTQMIQRFILVEIWSWVP